MVDTATRRSSSTSRRDRYLFFMYVTAEKNCSHKYVDPNGSSTSIAARDNSVYSSATAKIQAVWELENKVFNVRSLDSSSKASSRFVGRWVLDSENGCRIQSYSSGCVSFGKYFLNCSKRLRRWPVMCSFRLLRLSPFSSRCSSSSGNISTFPCSTRSAHLSSFFINASTLSFIVKIFVFGPCNDRLSMLSLSKIHAK